MVVITSNARNKKIKKRMTYFNLLFALLTYPVLLPDLLFQLLLLT